MKAFIASIALAAAFGAACTRSATVGHNTQSSVDPCEVSTAESTRALVAPKAQQYIAAFEQDRLGSIDARGFLDGTERDADEIEFLRRALKTNSNEDVRENIVDLLAHAGVEREIAASNASVLREPRILKILMCTATGPRGIAKMRAIDRLREHALPADLNRFDGAIARALEAAPSDDMFLLTAKAKASSAKAVVERISASGPWSTENAARIARAALGNASIEREFVRAATVAESARDAEALGVALRNLGWVGTENALRAVAEHLRTPLVTGGDNPMSHGHSVRLDALRALSYNFPEVPLLYSNNISREEDFTAAEQFCTRKWNVTYTGTPPPFLTQRAVPHPMPMPQ